MSKPATTSNTAIVYLRWSIVAIGILLPTLSLIPLGTLWLFERGYLLYWALATALTSCIAFGLQFWLLRDIARAPKRDIGTETPASSDWTPLEQEAWTKVQNIQATINPATLTTQDEILQLAKTTIEAVARTIHPETKDPLWQFTAPEALALNQRVSMRVKSFIEQNIPLGDRLTIAQILRAYRWRGAIKAAETAYDVWRAVRLLNPVAAATSELRERISKQMLDWGRDRFARQLARVYVEEVGRAAIDLYSGRLMLDVDTDQPNTTASASTADVEAGEPLRVLIAGQVSTGKSSLINALAGEVNATVDILPATSSFVPHALVRDAFPAAILIDSPGISTTEKARDELITAAADADLVLYTLAANRADRHADQQVLDAMASHFANHPDRRAPPVLCVVTHIDRLRPFQDWSPPYDLAATGSPKAASIRAAIEAIAADLNTPTATIIPIALPPDQPAYNIDALWARINEQLPDAKAANLIRRLRRTETELNWSRVMSQAIKGGRLLVGTAFQKDQK